MRDLVPAIPPSVKLVANLESCDCRGDQPMKRFIWKATHRRYVGGVLQTFDAGESQERIEHMALSKARHSHRYDKEDPRSSVLLCSILIPRPCKMNIA